MHDIAQSLRRGLGYPERVASPEFAVRKSAQDRYTRAEARRDMILLVGMLGPVELDGDAPLEDQPDASAMQQQLDDMLDKFKRLRGIKEPAVPKMPEPATKPEKAVKPEPAGKPMEQPKPNEIPKPAETPKPDEASKPVEPMKPTEPSKPAAPQERKITPEEILKKLEALRQEQEKKK